MNGGEKKVLNKQAVLLECARGKWNLMTAKVARGWTKLYINFGLEIGTLFSNVPLTRKKQQILNILFMSNLEKICFRCGSILCPLTEIFFTLWVPTRKKNRKLFLFLLTHSHMFCVSVVNTHTRALSFDQLRHFLIFLRQIHNVSFIKGWTKEIGGASILRKIDAHKKWDELIIYLPAIWIALY